MAVNPWIAPGAAAALSLERVGYAWIARAPAGFRRCCAHPALAGLGEPVAIVRKLFYGFKVVQLSVFAGWCYWHGDGSLAAVDPGPFALGAGGALILAGQALNASVFYRLGAVGVFYGDRLGYEVPRCRDFPFSVLSHPQYVGAVLSIWGFFVATRFPHDDWIVLPALETLYHAVGAALEGRGALIRSRIRLRGAPGSRPTLPPRTGTTRTRTPMDTVGLLPFHRLAVRGRYASDTADI